MHLCLLFCLIKNPKTQPREANRNYTDVLQKPEQSIRAFTACLRGQLYWNSTQGAAPNMSFLKFAEKPCIRKTPESYESPMANLQLMENNFEKSNIWKWISETCHTATCTSLMKVLTPWLTVKLFWPRWAKALYVLWEMRLLGTGCYYKAARYPARKPQQAKQLRFRYLTFGVETHFASLRWVKMFLLDSKNKPQHMRALYGMHLLGHGRIWFLFDPDIDCSLCLLAQTWANRLRGRMIYVLSPRSLRTTKSMAFWCVKTQLHPLFAFIQHHEDVYRRGRPVP